MGECQALLEGLRTFGSGIRLFLSFPFFFFFFPLPFLLKHCALLFCCEARAERLSGGGSSTSITAEDATAVVGELGRAQGLAMPTAKAEAEGAFLNSGLV